MSEKEASEILGVHQNTVKSWLKRGLLESLDERDVETLRKEIYED